MSERRRTERNKTNITQGERAIAININPNIIENDS